MSKHDSGVVALPEAFGERLDFDEDQIVLSILTNKILRRAIDTDAELILPPDIEKEALDVVEGLDLACADLDAALSGMSEIDTFLATWKEELTVGQASQT
jgi:hypothetical protein